MSAVLVDANVLLDIIHHDAAWYDWSAAALLSAAQEGVLVINPVIYAEVSIGLSSIELADQAMPRTLYRREAIPYEAAFLAGKVFEAYRRRGGTRAAPLPDFFIGAHAAIARYGVLTRDPRRYRRDFPTLSLIAPPRSV
jgi:predicted nucleic acid-binding protein